MPSSIIKNQPARPHAAECKVELTLLTGDDLQKRQDPKGVNRLKSEPVPFSPEYQAIHESRVSHPFYKMLEDFGKAYLKNRVIIVDSPTGSGKSTQSPQYVAGLLDESGCSGQVLHTQPRQIAAIGCANRVAVECDSKLGEVVGMTMRNKRVMPADPTQARIVVLTDGLLLQKMKEDKSLKQAACIIIDEVHELNSNMIVILGLLVSLLRERKDLRLVLMSATGNFGKLEAQFADFHPATITSLGKPQPLEIYYTAKVESSIEVAIWRLVRQIIVYDAARLPTGNILIFLPGEKEIHQVVDMLRFLPREFPVQAGNLQILKLYRDLNEVEASLVLKDKFDQNGNKMRKIVVATNIAETSVTFKDLDYVISSGENRTKAYQPRHNASVMVKSPCSQSQMLQQFGRAGRQRPGMAIGLLTEEEFEKSPKHPEPPIRQIDLTSTILTLVTMGVKDIANFSWTDEPHPEQIARAMYNLTALGMIESSAGGLRATVPGRQAAKDDMEPSRYILFDEAKKSTCTYELLVMLAIMETGDIRKSSIDDRDTAREVWHRYSHPSSDHLTLVNTWLWWKRYQSGKSEGHDATFALQHFLNRKKCMEVDKCLDDLIKKLGRKVAPEPTSAKNMSTAKIEMALLKSCAPNLVARYNVSRNTQPKWVYQHVRGPSESSGSVELKKSFTSVMGSIDINPEYLVYNEITMRPGAEGDEYTMNMITSISEAVLRTSQFLALSKT